MSLINDALKRAKQAQKEHPPAAAANLQFRPADPSQHRNQNPPVILFVVLLVVVALGGVLLLYGWRRNSPAPQVVSATQPAVALARTEPTTTPPSVAAQPSNPQTPATAATDSASTPSPAAEAGTVETTTNAATTAVVVPVEPPKPAGPKLQGIFFNPNRPSAVVSGKTVYIGDKVGGFRVLAITAEDVTLGSTSQTNVLRLD